MNSAIIYSSLDIAGSNACKQLRQEHEFKENGEKTWEAHGVVLKEIGKPIIESDFLAGELTDFDLIIFTSKHVSKEGKPAFTAHCTGNFGPAQYGGSDGEIALASAHAVKTAIDFFKENTLTGFDVTMEATHHGPTSLTVPCIFIEMGSTEKQWSDKKAGGVLAECVWQVARKWWWEKTGPAIAFGGGHYCPAFNELLDEYAFSHIAPKHAMEFVDEEMIKQMIEKTSEKPVSAVIDDKGIKSADKQIIVNWCEENDTQVEIV